MGDFFKENWDVLGVSLSYFIAVALVAMHADDASRRFLLRHLDVLRVRIEAANGALAPQLVRRVDALKPLLMKGWGRSLMNDVLAGWRHAHDIERLALPNFPLHELQSIVITAPARLRATGRRDALALAAQIDPLLRDGTWRTAKKGDLLPLVLPAVKIIDGHRDTFYEGEAYLLAKSVWFSLFGIVFVVALAVWQGHEELLLLGAAGGLLSRLARVLVKRPSPGDYGSSWSSLFLAPVGGALAGWAGILLISILAGFSVLDDSLATVWDEPSEAKALGIAFLLGFSERLFNNITKLGEERLSPARPPTPADVQEDMTAMIPLRDQPATGPASSHDLSNKPKG